jgi:hypothetical protein
VQAGRVDLDDSANQDAAVVTNNLSVSSGAQLNLDGGSLIVDYTGSSPASTLIADIGAGRITGVGGVVGADEASNLGITSFRGVAVDPTTFVMIRTLAGDTTLDQTVDFNDLLALAQGYGAAGTWADGDSDYNGNVDFNDLLALAQNYGGSLLQNGSIQIDESVAAQFEQDWALALSMVPEPTLVAFAGVAMVLAGRRRR